MRHPRNQSQLQWPRQSRRCPEGALHIEVCRCRAELRGRGRQGVDHGTTGNDARRVVNALRDKVGLGAQQTPGPATNVQNGYREYAMQAMEQGQQRRSPFEQWMPRAADACLQPSLKPQYQTCASRPRKAAINAAFFISPARTFRDLASGCHSYTESAGRSRSTRSLTGHSMIHSSERDRCRDTTCRVCLPFR